MTIDTGRNKIETFYCETENIQEASIIQWDTEVLSPENLQLVCE